MDKVIQIATAEFGKLLPEGKASGIEVEEVEEHPESGHYLVTIGYWMRDNKPRSKTVDVHTAIQTAISGNAEAILNPWRRKYKHVEVDPKQDKAVAIRMYEPPIGVS